jgi:hypothetical protein
VAAAGAVAAADAVTAMLASTIPGTSLGDPFGGGDPLGGGNPDAPDHDATAQVTAVRPEREMPSANGSEAAT